MSSHDDILTLLASSDHSDQHVISLFKTFELEQLNQLHPSYFNPRDLSQPLLYWCIIYERLPVLDFLVDLNGLRGPCLFHSWNVDALTFSIKMNKHRVTDHLLINYSRSFNLIQLQDRGNVGKGCECKKDGEGRREDYKEQLDYAHGLETRFANDENRALHQQQYLSNLSNLRLKTQSQLNEYKVELVFKNSPKTKALKNASRYIAKYMNFLLTFDL